jgi:hypothetical protein
MPGMPGRVAVGWLEPIGHPDQVLLVPLVRLACLLAVVLLALTGGWRMRRPGGPAGRQPDATVILTGHY